MKIHGVMIKDEATGKFFAFVRQFPAVCAQGNSVEEAHAKVNAYWKAFTERMKNQDVQMDDTQITTM